MPNSSSQAHGPLFFIRSRVLIEEGLGFMRERETSVPQDSRLREAGLLKWAQRPRCEQNLLAGRAFAHLVSVASGVSRRPLLPYPLDGFRDQRFTFRRGLEEISDA